MICTRFAPSPTGEPHLGIVRTALFSWLWAKKNNGQFIFRLEDTDQARFVPQSVQDLQATLDWLGLIPDFSPDKPSPDFGPCRQSERLANYQAVAQSLLDRGLAYKDWSTPDQLQAARLEAARQKKPFVFRQSMAKEGSGQPTIRLKIPDDLKIEWADIVKGEQSWVGKDIGDFVLLKSDGWPTYQLANVVDDHQMRVSHVIRADEWLSSTPKHLYLFDLLGWTRPTYIHLPPILETDGKRKLSKRRGAASVLDYKKRGYLPEAIVNYLSLLGWNPGGQEEIFEKDQLIKLFSLERLQTSGARFDEVRLDWFNGQHLRRQGPKERLGAAQNWWPPAASQFDDDYKAKVLELVYERLKNWDQLAQYSQFFFADPRQVEFDLEAQVVAPALSLTIETLGRLDFSESKLEQSCRDLAQELDLKTSQYFMLLRQALTGSKVAPGLFATMSLLGKETCLERLKNAAPSSNG